MPSRAFRRTTTGDFTALLTGAGAVGRITGARLAAASAAATAQITDANGTVLADLAAIVNGSDELDQEVVFEGKVTLAAISGAGASVIVYVA